MKNLQQSFLAKLVETAERQPPGVVLLLSKGVLKISHKSKERVSFLSQSLFLNKVPGIRLVI